MCLLEVDALSDREDLEPDRAQFVGVEDAAAVKHHGGLGHRLVDRLPVERLELVPLGQDADPFGARAGLHRRRADLDLLLDCRRSAGGGRVCQCQTWPTG